MLREAFRVLKPGGRFAVSDVVTRGAVPEQVRRDMLLWVGCIAGALEEDEYRTKLKTAGFEAIGIEPTRVYRVEDAREFLSGKGLDVDTIAESVDGKFMSAFVRATKPQMAERSCYAVLQLAGRRMSDRPFNVLFLCTGNLTRLVWPFQFAKALWPGGINLAANQDRIDYSQCHAPGFGEDAAMGTALKTQDGAFRALYEANQQRVRRLLVRMAVPTEAEDLTQIVFAKAAKALPTFRGDAEASTWLYRIAVNVASDWLRSRSMHEAKMTVPLPDASDEDKSTAATGAAAIDMRPSPEQELTSKDMNDCLRGEIGKLPDAYRDVFMLSALGGLTDEEIGQTLGISQGNAKVRLHRARQEFKKIIESRCDFYRNELSCKPSSPDCCASSMPSGGAKADR